MINVQLADEIKTDQGHSPVDITLIEKAAHKALLHASQDADVTVVVTDDEQIQILNRQFLEKDAPTDVLAFYAGDTDPDSLSVYLGDVIISYPRALAQAAAGGHSITDELQLLVVHGVLHLLGHDHADLEQKAVMQSAQTEILTQLGCSLTPPSL